MGDTTAEHSPARFTLESVGEVPAHSGFARDVQQGLSGAAKSLPCRHFYDAVGSALFESICALPEYYLLRAEQEILQRHADTLAALAIARGRSQSTEPDPEATRAMPIELVELGSGSAEKTRFVIEALLRRQGTLRYVPIDVSRAALEQSARHLLASHPQLSVHALLGDYADALDALNQPEAPARLLLWLGSSIGNLERSAAGRFLARVRRSLHPRDLLCIGIDLRKPVEVLEAAYDDAQGITARFNLNLLRRINDELGGDFDLDAFEHRATYDAHAGRIAMSLVSLRDQRVHIRTIDLTIELEAGESIHTEFSYKYGPEEIEALAKAAGLRVLEQWTDHDQRFVDVLFVPA